VVVVSKPPSMPVHHAGQYRKNTVVGHLAAFHNITDVKPVHRLDRNVSGIHSFSIP
jgi:23S rRNA-/tRNA-specific pseudouridylate synthase